MTKEEMRQQIFVRMVDKLLDAERFLAIDNQILDSNDFVSRRDKVIEMSNYVAYVCKDAIYIAGELVDGYEDATRPL